MRLLFLFSFLLLFSLNSTAENEADRYLDSELYSKPVEVVKGVWTAIGATQPPTSENAGHNNNLSFIVSNDGVLVVNSGASSFLARALHDEIKKITDQPVRYVVLENGQGHAMLGSNYWQKQGAKIIAHDDAIIEIEKYGADEAQGMMAYNRDRGMDTTVIIPDISFSERLEI